jgi:hypothetical protein
LLNGEFIHQKHPDTFAIPSEDIRMGRSVGDHVQLIFREVGHADERMWVYITAVQAPGQYTGVLNNDPVYLEGIACDDPVTFQAKHIIKYLDPTAPMGLPAGVPNEALVHPGCNTPTPHVPEHIHRTDDDDA